MVTKVDQVCPGDCSKCKLLQEGVISDMIPCILDQIFQRVKENRRMLEENNLMLNKILSSMESNDTSLNAIEIANYNDKDTEYKAEDNE